MNISEQISKTSCLFMTKYIINNNIDKIQYLLNVISRKLKSLCINIKSRKINMNKKQIKMKQNNIMMK